ncbi:MAG: SDR family oxidoreductase [Pleurocapsa sp. MO_226.B13]|nr:SDR family oxidoreductase [Pleurocapsa sp. MO_226.B13]
MKNIYPSIKEKVVLITGANHGIGAATAKTFASQGAKVFLTYFRESCEYSSDELNKAREKGIGGVLLYRANQQQTSETIVDEIRSEGGIAAACEIDLSIAENIPILFDLCKKKLGEAEILINNHTYCALDTFDPALKTDEGFGVQIINGKNIDSSFAINARAYALMMSEYTRRFLERKAETGRIINLSTDAAHAHESNVSYAASKHAIESYSRSAAIELGRYGITVNIVAPGPIQTGYLTPEEEIQIAANTPLRRIGEPGDVADVIVFLASEQARWLTGQLIYVGGGWRMHQ